MDPTDSPSIGGSTSYARWRWPELRGGCAEGVRDRRARRLRRPPPVGEGREAGDGVSEEELPMGEEAGGGGYMEIEWRENMRG
jgi:hypothetical protein